MSEMSFESYWEAIKKNVEATGYPIPDEDLATIAHMDDQSVEDFLNEFKAAIDAERGE